MVDHNRAFRGLFGFQGAYENEAHFPSGSPLPAHYRDGPDLTLCFVLFACVALAGNIRADGPMCYTIHAVDLTMCPHPTVSW